MKKLLLFPFVVAGLSLSAQVTLTSAVHGWMPGDNYNTTTCDTVGINPGPSGTGQTWNFSNIVISGSPSTSPIVAPASTPYGSNFPTATCASGNSGGYYYYQATAGSLKIVGLGTPSYIMDYSNDDELMVYPFSYGNSNSETHTASYTVASYTGTRGGSTDITADGSGTLVLPSGSYNVLRVKTIQVDRDSFVGTGVNTTTVVYAWYSATQKFPLFQIQFTTQVSGAGTQTLKGVLVNSNIVGVESRSLLSSLVCFPNPAQDQMQVRASLVSASEVTMELTDLTGRVVLHNEYGEQPEGEITAQLDLSALGAGTYLLNIRTGKNVTTQKVVVQ